MNVEYISGLMEKRKERYEAVADVTAVSYTHLVTVDLPEIAVAGVISQVAKVQQVARVLMLWLTLRDRKSVV